MSQENEVNSKSVKRPLTCVRMSKSSLHPHLEKVTCALRMNQDGVETGVHFSLFLDFGENSSPKQFCWVKLVPKERCYSEPRKGMVHPPD